MTPAVEQFRDAIRAAGLSPPDNLEPGRFHRVPGYGKRNGNTAGWCKLFDDCRGGVFGDYSTDLSQSWQAERAQPLTPAEREAFRHKVEGSRALAEAKRQAEYAGARKRAAQIWNAAKPADPNHPYLVAKGVKPHGIRQQGNDLVIPMRDASGALHSVQFISPDGSKKFLPGGRVTGCYFSIGKPDEALCIDEGFATGASIHEATGHAVAVAFNAGNLGSVAVALRAKLSDVRMVLCADDDYRTDGNPGIAKVTEAALAVGGLVAIPDFGPNRAPDWIDFNDLHQHRGAESVKQAVANARAPEISAPQPDEKNAPSAILGGEVSLIRGDSITPEPVNWIWGGWLAAGKFHVLAGQPGAGKTTLALAFAATITSGGCWPDGSRAEAANVLIWSGEDDPGDTLVPRLRAMGANMSRVYFVGDVRDGVDVDARSFDPARDVLALVRKAETIGDIGLLIVDPVVSAVSGDSHKNAETRRSLQPLVDLATKLHCAVLGISHFTKGTSGREPIERVTGSLAFGAHDAVQLPAIPDQILARGERTGALGA
jgi:putative DNA primase/helicase